MTKPIIREHYGLAIDITPEQEHEHSAFSRITGILEDLMNKDEITNFHLTYLNDEQIEDTNVDPE